MESLILEAVFRGFLDRKNSEGEGLADRYCGGDEAGDRLAVFLRGKGRKAFV